MMQKNTETNLILKKKNILLGEEQRIHLKTLFSPFFGSVSYGSFKGTNIYYSVLLHKIRHKKQKNAFNGEDDS